MQSTHHDTVNGSESKGAFTIPDFCSWASISRTKVYDEINHGRLTIRKVGKRSLILRADAEAWLNSLPVSA